MRETQKNRPRVVVAGAGFGGLWTAKRLAKYSVDVILVDRNNYHTFLPLLYQVAAAEVGPEEISSRSEPSFAVSATRSSSWPTSSA